MSFRDAFARVRVEDALAVLFAVSLILVLGLRSAVAGVKLDEGQFWSYSFILAPVAVLVFMASLRYALAGGSGQLQATAVEVLRVLRDWLPFLFLLLFYEAFNTEIWNHVHVVDRDQELLELDRLLFGETPAAVLEGLARPWLTDLLSVAYFLHLILPPILAVALYRQHKSMFRELLLAVMLCAIVGSLGYMAVPAVGPGIAFPEIFEAGLRGEIYRPLTGLMDIARVPRDVFPSLHVAISSVILYYAAVRRRRWLVFFLPLILGNWIATVYLRYHYLVDVIAGWFTAVLVIVAAKSLLRLETIILEK